MKQKACSIVIKKIHTSYYIQRALKLFKFSGSASLVMSNCNVKSPFSCSSFILMIFPFFSYYLIFLLNVKFSHFFIFWFFKYLIGRHFCVSQCLRWQMILMNTDRHKISLEYKGDLKNFERCKIILNFVVYSCMLHILQMIKFKSHPTPSLLHPLISTLQIFLIYPRIWLVHCC